MVYDISANFAYTYSIVANFLEYDSLFIYTQDKHAGIMADARSVI